MQLLLVLAFAAIGLVQSSAPTPLTHVTRSGEITLQAPVERVFPLFGPIDESKWAEGWEPSIKYGSNSQAGTVFTIDDPHPMTWILTRFESQSHRLQYVIVTQNDRVMQIDVGCRAAGDTETLCSVAYSLTALAPSAQPAIENYTEERHHERLMHFQMALNHYLKTGTRITHHE